MVMLPAVIVLADTTRIVVDHGTDWPGIVAAAAAVVTATIIIISAVYARDALAEARRDRYVQVLGDLAGRWASQPMEEARAAMSSHSAHTLAEMFRSAYEPTTEGDARAKELLGELEVLLRVPSFYEDVALLVESGGLDSDMVWRWFAGPALGCWRYWSEAVAFMQERDGGSYVEYEKLVEGFRARTLPQPKKAARGGESVPLGEVRGKPSGLHSNEPADRTGAWRAVCFSLIALSALGCLVLRACRLAKR
jgi:hypothetical protein